MGIPLIGWLNSKIKKLQLSTSKRLGELEKQADLLANLNINAEEKVTTSGYGIISLPKNAANGQVSATVRGNTISQLADNGASYVNWVINGAGTTKGINGIHLVQDGALEFADIPITLKPSTQYTLIYNVKSKSVGLSQMTLQFDIPLGYAPIFLGVNKVSFTSLSTPTGKIRFVLPSSIANGEYIDFTDVMIVEGDQTTNQLLNQYISYGTKSTVGAMRLKSVSADETETSTAYVVAKDEEGNIAELRSLPNGTNDEIRVSGGKAELVKRVSDNDILESLRISSFVTNVSDILDIVYITGVNFISNSEVGNDYANIKFTDGRVISQNQKYDKGIPWSYYQFNSDFLRVNIPKGYFASITEAKNYFMGATLTYQLATPIEIPIQTSGSLVSYPSGTIYVDPIVADADFYGEGVSVEGAKFVGIDKVTKVDLENGVEIDVTDSCTLNEQNNGFTSDELQPGDICWYELEIDPSITTMPETSITYYDSRYAVVDDSNDKVYKWKIASANGEPRIVLEEI